MQAAFPSFLSLGLEDGHIPPFWLRLYGEVGRFDFGDSSQDSPWAGAGRPSTGDSRNTLLEAEIPSSHIQASERHINIKIPLRKPIASASFGTTF